MGAIHYIIPEHWIKYDPIAVSRELVDAKAAVIALTTMPYQRRWVEELQKIQLKMEISGTSRIEGADFAGNELDLAIKAESPEELLTRSQKQASAAVMTYKWIAKLPDDMPMSEDVIRDIHRLIVTNCDDDHCQPGHIREKDQNVTFGNPRHRGTDGGAECKEAFERLASEAQTTYREHDQLIQALAVHYHLAAMHPFDDGNGRTARALEAFMLQKAGLKDSLFIAMSNYYYEEKPTYLSTLAAVRSANHDLTPFLKFGLRGIALQSARLTKLIKQEVSKGLFRNLMNDLFTRLESTRKRVIVKRQLGLLNRLLDARERIDLLQLIEQIKPEYQSRKNPSLAIIRDVVRLRDLGAIRIGSEMGEDGKPKRFYIDVNLDWPREITEQEFFIKLAALPKSKEHSLLRF